ncbi:hypothetical protein HMPREF1624_03743 [Sporothrix schenckii ATCC 58251]|uniref:Uncharacterized protein n=1 Tax=Sporothrix schenckii (strain ATCC 58251 / de Perez 2211183) TaxID=1391915 RepID=U7PZL2_SPOS1|nr:hypothetical protein HMPREF1624_03743 [Sporothrix schenckii ATCC 58251]
MLSLASIASLAALAPSAYAALTRTPCPLLNVDQPAPSQLETVGSSYVKDAINSTELQFLAASNGLLPYGQYESNTTAFSAQVYSVASGEPLFTFSYNPPGLVAAHTVGVTDIATDTVFRLGSVSKLWTIYVFLIAAGDRSWSDPITDYVPELAALVAADGDTTDSLDHVDWSSVTVGSLASQLGGIARDAAYSPQLQALLGSAGVYNAGGFNQSTCGDDRLMIPCNRTAFFEDFPQQRPIFASYVSPAYSNAAFQILGYALENMTGSSMPDLFDKHLVQPLNLTGTYYTVPPEDVTGHAMIPYNATYSWWNADARDETVAGGFYSTLDDMRKVGTAMLRSAQLSAVQTRRWLKPHSFLADPNAAVGAPWEIMRAPDSPGAPVSWMYTKAGDLGLYSSMVALLPELGLGFNVLSAGTDTTNTVRIVSDILASTWVPRIRAAARAEAAANYAGQYADTATNSSFTVVADGSEPGLAVTEWMYGGLSVLDLLGQLEGTNASLSQKVVMNLYPSGLTRASANSSCKSNKNETEVGWRATFQVLPAPLDAGPFSAKCIAWEVVSQLVYGGVALDEFLFTVDANGKAVSLSPRVLAQTQTRTATTATTAKTASKRWSRNGAVLKRDGDVDVGKQNH